MLAKNIKKGLSKVYDYFSARDLVLKQQYIFHLKGEFQPDNPQLKLIGYETQRYCKKVSFFLGKLPNFLDLMWLLFAREMNFDLNTTLLGFIPLEFARAFARSVIHSRQSSQESELIRRMNAALIPSEDLVPTNNEFGYGGDYWKK
ncbi:hypothetical protein FJZ17_03355 [Candidatus Pacearchaeota archaeon]|nr:hypothetical protein [Candidatus Pacearchaeota archaeon]